MVNVSKSCKHAYVLVLLAHFECICCRICGIGTNITETEYLSDTRRNFVKMICKWHCFAGLFVVGI